MSSLTRLVPLVVLVASSAAYAGQQEAEAEHIRLSEEMARLTKRSAWRGVEAAYLKMLELEKDGVVLSYENHWFGAQAARSLGDVTSTYQRVKRAFTVDRTEEARTFIQDINAHYAPVDLKIDPKYEGPAGLTVAMLPFEPDQRAAIQAAQEKVVAERGFTGLLPLGEYAFGTTTITLTEAGAELEPKQAILAPAVASRNPKEPKAGGGGGADRHTGIRLDVGTGYAGGGGGTVTIDGVGDLGVDGMAGLGLGGGLGFELGLTSSIGALVEVGYRGLLPGGAPDASATSGTGTSKEGYGLFNIWLAPSFWAGHLGIAAGPTWGIGSGKGNLLLTDGSPAAATAASIKAVGGELGVFYGLVPVKALGKANMFGLGVQGGYMGDGSLGYTFAQLSLGFGPGQVGG